MRTLIYFIAICLLTAFATNYANSQEVPEKTAKIRIITSENGETTEKEIEIPLDDTKGVEEVLRELEVLDEFEISDKGDIEIRIRKGGKDIFEKKIDIDIVKINVRNSWLSL